MKTITREVSVKVADSVPDALEWLKTEHPRGIDLVCVDYRDDLREQPEKIQELLKTGCGDFDWIHDAQADTTHEILEEYRKAEEADEIAEAVQDAMRDWMYEHDTSAPERDLMRNTGSVLCYLNTKDWMQPPQTGKDITREVKMLSKKYGQQPERKKEYRYLLNNAYSEAPISFYFYLDLEDAHKALWEEKEEPYVIIKRAYISNIDRIQGGNWLGNHAVFDIALPRAVFLANLYLDRAKGTGYGWNKIAGQTDYEEAALYTCENSGGGCLVEAETSPAQERERKLAEKWEKTKECTAGDMNITRHGKTNYINDFPCGSKCVKCGTFWID